MSYWDGIVRDRVSRRRFLRTSAAVGMGAAALSFVGCGSDSNSSSTGSSSSGTPGAKSTGLLSKPVDTTASAVRGGILPGLETADTPGFGLFPAASSNVTFQSLRVYSKLFKLTMANTAKGEAPVSTVEGDIFSSFEESPDGLTITGKLRPDAGFNQRAPTNGRKVSFDDIKFSWDKFKAAGRARGTLSNDVNKTAPITSITSADGSTVVIKLAFPSPSVMQNLAYHLNGAFVLPTEADGKFDPNKDERGSGPWTLDKYEPSVMFQYRRNQNYYSKDRPILDGLDLPIIPDYSNQLAQFRAGRVYTFALKPEDIIPAKKDLPELVLQQGLYSTAVTPKMQIDLSSGSQWRDDRLRQALSMSIDRDLLTETLNNVDAFRKEGVDMDVRWNTAVGAGETEFWLDPKGKDFGDTAKYFKHDLAAATALVKAAGKDKVESNWYYPPPPTYGAAFQQAAQILRGMFEEGSFKITTMTPDYNTVFSPKIVVPASTTGGHSFQGVALVGVAAFAEVDSWFTTSLMPGGTFFMFEQDYPAADDKWYSLLQAQQKEQDRKKRADLIKDFQRYAASKMYFIPAYGQVPALNIAWPWAGNFGVYQTRGDGQETTYWLDKSKMKS